MKRLAGSVAAALLLLLPAVASADATRDVKELRAGKLPVRYEWLGWSGSTAHLRTLVCSEGGTTSCTAAIVKQSEARLERVELLSVQELYCGPGSACAPLDAATVNAFVGRERVANAALPVLAQGRAVTDPARVFGAVAGEATTVQLRVRDASNQDGPKLDTELVLRGKGGALETLGVLDRGAYRFNGGAIQGAHLSDDGKTAAFAVQFAVGVMCWDFAGLQTVVVDLARKQASLANTIGWRAYQKGDMVAALAGFTESTSLDPSFGLGWYNRASVESRNGDLAKAKSSFEQALKLDSLFAKRACKDPDFKALRAAEPALFGC
jgi:hypothetical protein